MNHEREKEIKELTDEEILTALEGVLGRSLQGWELVHEDDVGQRRVYTLKVIPEGRCLLLR